MLFVEFLTGEVQHAWMRSSPGESRNRTSGFGKQDCALAAILEEYRHR
jgi:hypothetical protein